MKKITTQLFLILLLLTTGLVGCVNLNPDNNDIESPVGVIPADFDWKTVKELSFTVQVQSVSGVSDASARIIKIYNSPLLNSGALIASGAAKPGSPYITKLTLATALQTIYVQETLSTGTSTVKSVDVTSTSLSVTFTKSSMITAGAPIMTKAVTVPSVTLASNYDVTLTASSTNTITGFAANETSLYGNKYKSYIIPAGVTNTQINPSGYGNHAILYVAGTLTLNAMSLNHTSLYILPTGKVTVTSFSNGQQIVTDVPSVYIAAGGTLTLTGSGELSNGAYSINNGTITSTDDFTVSTSSELYNQGTITLYNSKNGKTATLHITNYTEFYNSSTINAEKINITTNAVITNDASGVITVPDYYQTSSSVVNNLGEIAATTSFKTSSTMTLNNYCHITAALGDLQGSGGVFNFYTGSLFNCQDLTTNNIAISLHGGSMMLIGTFSAIYNMDVTNTDNSYSLIKCSGNIPDLRWAASEFSGKIELVHANLVANSSGTNGSQLYATVFGSNTSGAIISQTQTQNIVSTTCNSGLGQIAGSEPEVIDVDGDGIPVDSDVDDDNANVAFVSYFPSESQWGSYAFEDLWPSKGDYDVNDIVMDFRVTTYSNASNLVTKVKIDYNVRASGSMLNLGAAFQFDKINAASVASVTGQILGTGGYFTTASNGTESGVTLAVVPLFNSQKDLLNYSQYLNTEVGKTHYNTPDNSVTINFSSGISQSNVTIENLNFFITANSRGKEIHLPTYNYTSKFSTSLISGITFYNGDIYKYIDGMMWGLMLPQTFNHPIERAAINEAYLHFGEWATSGGTAYTDWYEQKSGYTNSELIYSY